MPKPAINAPRVLNLAIITGTITGGLFMIICLFSIQSVDSVTNSATGLPFMQLSLDVVGLDGSAVLLAIYISNGVFQLFSIMYGHLGWIKPICIDSVGLLLLG